MKFLETNIKYYVGNRPSDIKAISCVPSDIYCQRFIENIDKITNYKNDILTEIKLDMNTVTKTEESKESIIN
jgi:hypothetical protein